MAAASHWARGAAVHEARGPQQRQGGLCQGSLQQRGTRRQSDEDKGLEGKLLVKMRKESEGER